jgi:anti-sigma B factor antagonist
MQISTRKVGDISLVKVSGAIDSETVDEFGLALAHLAASNEYRAILDIGELAYINTAGLSLVADLFKKATQNGGSLKLLHAREPIRELLHIVRFDRLIELFDDEHEAIESFLGRSTEP